MLIEGQEQSNEKADSYSLFLYAVRSPLTRDYYLRCLRIFINHINLLPNVTIEERCNLFAASGIKDPSWAFHCIIKFLQSQRERVEKEEITGATLRNYVKSIKLFCEMTDIPIAWKKITRGLPKIRMFADDRAPTLEESPLLFLVHFILIISCVHLSGGIINFLFLVMVIFESKEKKRM